MERIPGYKYQNDAFGRPCPNGSRHKIGDHPVWTGEPPNRTTNSREPDEFCARCGMSLVVTAEAEKLTIDGMGGF
jgi:hypothetical protein